MAARDDIAAAASTVEGINCTPFYRQSTKSGDAHVRRGPDNRDASGFGFMTTWQVWVVLSQDLTSTEKWIDANGAALTAALRREMTVLSLTPTELLIGATTTNGVIAEGTRESD